MRIRTMVPGFLVASVCGAALVSASLLNAPAADAQCTAGEVWDQRTGVCWSQAQTSLGVSGPGGWCKPGRLGLCIAAWQNSPVPGAALQPAPPAGPAPRQTWPRG